MFNVGLGELLLFMMIAVIILGPERLPQGVKMLLNGYRKMKSLIQHVQTDIEKELQLLELKAQMQEEMKKIREMEQKLAEQFRQMEQYVDFQQAQNGKPSSAMHYVPLQLNPYAPDSFYLCGHPMTAKSAQQQAA